MTRPTYGSELDAAESQLHTAHVALHMNQDPGVITDVRTLANAQRQLYRALCRQVVFITGHNHSPLATNLAVAAARSTAVLTNTTSLTAPAEPVSPAALALRNAADHALTATDILSSHVAPDGAARTPDGVTLLTGLHRSTHLAAIARLVVTTVHIDRELQLQLRAHNPDDVKDPITRILVQNVQSAPGAPTDLILVAEKTASAEPPLDTYLTGITTAVDVSGPTWPPVVDHPSFIDALDATRTWLTQHHQHDLTGQHLRLMLGAGLALTTELANLASRRDSPLVINVGAAHATQQWRIAYLNTENVITPGRDEPAAGPAALAAAEAWLRRQLRHRGAWRINISPAGRPSQQQWERTAAALAVRLPDIATMLHRGVTRSIIRGDLYALDSQDHHTSVVRRPQWTAATLDTPQIARLLTVTHHLHDSTMLLTNTTGATTLPGSFETHLRTTRTMATIAAIAAIPDPATAVHRKTTPTDRHGSSTDQPAFDTPKQPRPLPPLTNDSPIPVIATLSERLRRAERQGWTTTKLSISDVRDLRDTINNLATDIARLHAHIRRHDLISTPRPAEPDPSPTDATDQAEPHGLAPEITQPDVE